MLRDAITGYVNDIIGGKGFKASELYELMEPGFAAEGFRTPRPNRQVQEILVVRDDAAGDFVLFSGFLRELRRIYQGAHITIVVSARSENLARCCPYVDNIELNEMKDAGNDGTALRYETQFAMERLWPHKFDLAFAGRLGVKSMSIILTYLSGARDRVAFSQARPNPVNWQVIRTDWENFVNVPVPFTNEILHDVDRNFLLLEHLLRLPIVNRSLEVWYTNQDVQRAKALLGNFLGRRIFVVVPFASIRSNEWPIDKWAEFLRALAAREPSVSFLLMGGPGNGNEENAAHIAQALGDDRALSIVGKTTFREAAAVMRHCGLYIGSDTGLMHIAAACGLPALVQYSFPASLNRMPTSNPWRFSPYGVPGVGVLPPRPLSEDCNTAFARGCNKYGEHHCITLITPGLMMKGYGLILQRVARHERGTQFISEK